MVDVSSSRLLFRLFHHQNKAQKTMELKTRQTRPSVIDNPTFVDELEAACEAVGEVDEDEDEMDTDRV